MPSKYYTNTGVYVERGRRIKKKRKLLNLSQKELAKDCGFSYSVISKAENGNYATVEAYIQLEYILDIKLKTHKDELIKFHKDKISEHAEMIRVLETIH